MGVILGLDPGMTVGLALIDDRGNIIIIDSRKHFNVSKIISLVNSYNSYGSVEVIAADTVRIPKLLLRISAKLGTGIINPKKDLTIKRKKDIVIKYDKDLLKGIKNKHELAALASSIYAYKKLKFLERKLSFH
ncbi:MAG: DUF460 domain-containing protein [Nanoarchaeota archaeon]